MSTNQEEVEPGFPLGLAISRIGHVCPSYHVTDRDAAALDISFGESWGLHHGRCFSAHTQSEHALTTRKSRVPVLHHA